MRAIAPTTGPRVLRVALVQSGRVIEERIVPRGAPVTIGPNERSTFVISAPGMSGSRAILAYRSDAYMIEVFPGMSGRIALASGMLDIASRTEAIRLDEEARGKITLGDATFLFHFIAVPIAVSKPRLPLSVERSLLDNLDWKTTFIAAFSFLFHFGAIGSIYSDWSDPVIDDEVRVAQLIQSLSALPGMPAVEQTLEPDSSKSAAPQDAGPKSTAPAPKSNGGPPTRVSGADKGGTPGAVSDVRARQISDQIAALDGLMTLGLNAPGRAVDGVLRDGNMPVAMLDGVAGNAAGVRPGDGIGLHMNNGPAGIVRPGLIGGDGLPGNLIASNQPVKSGTSIDVKKPVGHISVSPPTTGGGDLPDAGGVVAAMRGGFRACYNRGLADDPTMKGSVRITASVGPNGEVKSASPSVGGGSLSSSVVSCLAARVRSAQFSPPSGGGATVVIPIIFDVQ
ncbi:MAG: AgmX/PglI C-terminal domain-containing protein [Byssovorax sp.]